MDSIVSSEFITPKELIKSYSGIESLLSTFKKDISHFLSCFENIKISLMSVIEDFEKIFLGTVHEVSIQTLKQTCNLIFNPLGNQSNQLLSQITEALSKFNNLLLQKKEELFSSTTIQKHGDQHLLKIQRSHELLNDSHSQHPQDVVSNGKTLNIDTIRNELGQQRIELLSPCLQELVDFLQLFFHSGWQQLEQLIIYSHNTDNMAITNSADTPRNSTDLISPQVDISNLQPDNVYSSIHPVLQVLTANWLEANQAISTIRQQPVDIIPVNLLLATDAQMMRRPEEKTQLQLQQKHNLKILKDHLKLYHASLTNAPFKQFQVLGGFQYNPNDLLKTLADCCIEEEIKKLVQFYIALSDASQTARQQKVPTGVTFVIDNKEVPNDNLLNALRIGIQELTANIKSTDISNDTSNTGEDGEMLSNNIISDICTIMARVSSKIAVLLLFGKISLVSVIKSNPSEFKEKCQISLISDASAIMVEWTTRWYLIPSICLEAAYNNKSAIATISTYYRKRYNSQMLSNQLVMIETIDVKLESLPPNYKFSKSYLAIPSNNSSNENVTPSKNIFTQRTFSLPPESLVSLQEFEFNSNKLRHGISQHNIGLGLQDDSSLSQIIRTQYYKTNPFVSPSAGIANARSKTGSSESISSASTLKACNPQLYLGLTPGTEDCNDDVRQQLYLMSQQQRNINVDKTSESQAWGQHDTWTILSSGLDGLDNEEDRRAFFLDLFCDPSQELINDDDEKSLLSSPAMKDKTNIFRNHKRAMSSDSAQIHTFNSLENKLANSSMNMFTNSTPDLAKFQHVSGITNSHCLPDISDNIRKGWPANNNSDSEINTDIKSHAPPIYSNYSQDKSDDEFARKQLISILDSSLTDDNSNSNKNNNKNSNNTNNIWSTSKNIWGDEGLNGGCKSDKSSSSNISYDSDTQSSDSEPRDYYSKVQNTSARTNHKRHVHLQRAGMFSPTNSHPMRPPYHQPASHWEPNMRPEIPMHAPPQQWRHNAPWVGETHPQMTGPAPIHLQQRGPWMAHPQVNNGPPLPPRLQLPPHHNQHPPPHPPQRFTYFSPHPPPMLHSTPSPLPTPPESPGPGALPPPLPPHSPAPPMPSNSTAPPTNCPPAQHMSNTQIQYAPFGHHPPQPQHPPIPGHPPMEHPPQFHRNPRAMQVPPNNYYQSVGLHPSHQHPPPHPPMQQQPPPNHHPYPMQNSNYYN